MMTEITEGIDADNKSDGDGDAGRGGERHGWGELEAMRRHQLRRRKAMEMHAVEMDEVVLEVDEAKVVEEVDGEEMDEL